MQQHCCCGMGNSTLSSENDCDGKISNIPDWKLFNRRWQWQWRQAEKWTLCHHMDVENQWGRKKQLPSSDDKALGYSECMRKKEMEREQSTCSDGQKHQEVAEALGLHSKHSMTMTAEAKNPKPTKTQWLKGQWLTGYTMEQVMKIKVTINRLSWLLQ